MNFEEHTQTALALATTSTTLIRSERYRSAVGYLTSAVSIATVGYGLYKSFKENQQEAEVADRTFTLHSDTPFYESLKNRLVSTADTGDSRSGVFVLQHQIDDDNDVTVEAENLVDAGEWMTLTGLDYEAQMMINAIRQEDRTSRSGVENLIFRVSDEANYESLLSYLVEEHRKVIYERVNDVDDIPYLEVYTYTPESGFTVTSVGEGRPLESVIIEETIKNKITSHIDTFSEYRHRYKDLSLPYHTGILLHGPPGTGKTSLITSLGASYSRDVYILDLGAIEDDKEFNRITSRIGSNKFILLEDVDRVVPENGTKNMKGVTLSCFLNFLDGVRTPDGSIFIMTANDPSLLDPAITRPGRMDVSAHIDFFTSDMVVSFGKQFVSKNEEFISTLKEKTKNITPDNGISGAELCVPIKESMFLEVSGREEYFLDYINERINIGETGV